jgi:O-antigen ligase
VVSVRDGAGGSSSVPSTWRLALSAWSGPDAALARKVRQAWADAALVGFGLTLPWSTTAATVFIDMAAVLIASTVGIRPALAEMRRPALLLPVLLVLLAAAGTLWAFGIPWGDRLHALEKTAKLLLVPLLFIHFKESRQGGRIFLAFVGSNLVLLAASFLISAWPELVRGMKPRAPGVAVRNYIDQSQVFALLAIALGGLAVEMLRRARHAWALASALAATAFLANLAFVNIARTAFVYLPLMALLFMVRYARSWRFAAATTAALAVCVGLCAVSPNLQRKMERIPGEFRAFEMNSQMVGNDWASGAERLEFWRKSIGFMRSAPLHGHGTGSVRQLFGDEAIGRTGLGSVVVANPHNQTLAVAIQWGIAGCLLLYAMWASHLWLFREGLATGAFAAWLGLLVVAQNLASSLFNSHLIDFYQGWLYVCAVGIAGGLLHPSRLDPVRPASRA